MSIASRDRPGLMAMIKDVDIWSTLVHHLACDHVSAEATV